MTGNKIIIILLLFALAITSFSCSDTNIFGWLYEDEEDLNQDVSGLVKDGEEALEMGEWDKALKYFDEAIDKDQDNSQARWGYVKAYMCKYRADFLYLLSRIASNRENFSNDLENLIKNHDFANTLDVIISVIDHPKYSVVNKKSKGDHVVPYNDFMVCLNTATAYVFRAFLQMGDSNGDKNYFSTGDILKIQDDGKLFDYNPDIINLEDYEKSYNNSFADIYDIFSTNPTGGLIPKIKFNDMTMALHGLIEDTLYFYKNMYYAMDDFEQCFKVYYQGADGMGTYSEVLKDFVKEAEDLYDDFKQISDAADIDTVTLNNDHVTIVDAPAFTGYYTNFTYAFSGSWSSHDPAVPGQYMKRSIYTNGPSDNMTFGDLNLADFDDNAAVIYLISNATNIMADYKRMELLKVINKIF